MRKWGFARICRLLLSFQSAVPVTGIYVSRQHHDSMLPSVANKLSRSVKTHRLTIDQRSGKDSRIVAFYPRRHINQQRKTGGMRFRKPILSETADLLEDTFGEFAVVSSFDHSLHQLFMKFRDNARLPPRPHRAAKLIGFSRTKPGCHYRQTHRLFLKDRDSQSLVEH